MRFLYDPLGKEENDPGIIFCKFLQTLAKYWKKIKIKIILLLDYQHYFTVWRQTLSSNFISFFKLHINFYKLLFNY